MTGFDFKQVPSVHGRLQRVPEPVLIYKLQKGKRTTAKDLLLVGMYGSMDAQYQADAFQLAAMVSDLENCHRGSIATADVTADAGLEQEQSSIGVTKLKKRARSLIFGGLNKVNHAVSSSPSLSQV